MDSGGVSGNGVVPSRLQVDLRSLVGYRVVSLIRYSWWAPDEAEQECRLASKDVFSLTCGPAAIAFDSGVILGVASDPFKNSVSVWVERDRADLSVCAGTLSCDEELHPISANDPKFASSFWHRVIGAQVRAISLLVRKPRTARLAELPNEVGLCFLLDSGARVIAAHGLHDDSDDFAIIQDDFVLERICAELNEVQIG